MEFPVNQGPPVEYSNIISNQQSIIGDNPTPENVYESIPVPLPTHIQKQAAPYYVPTASAPPVQPQIWWTTRRKVIACIVGITCVLSAAAIVGGVLGWYFGRQKCEWKCSYSDGCILLSQKCDGKPHCSLGEDEWFCSYAVTTKTTASSGCEIKCTSSGLCVLYSQWCDGVTHCPNGEDEKYCVTTNATESESCEMKCTSSGLCVLSSQWCDGVSHCPNGEDEKYCVRLYGPDFRLQAYNPGVAAWLPVCSDYWSDNYGRLACQDFGYDTTSYYKTDKLYISSTPNGFAVLDTSIISDKFYRRLYRRSYCSSYSVVSLRCIECGNSLKSVPSKVVGGTSASIGDWPWQVSLQYYSTHSCGGSIITPKWIVTAAHCVEGDRVYPSRWTVSAGTLYSSSFSYYYYYYVERIIPHPAYNSKTKHNDIALMKLTNSLPFSNNIRPVCLPNPGIFWEAGQSCWVSGWGALYEGGKIKYLYPRTHSGFGIVGMDSIAGSSSYSLMQAEVPLIDSTTCNQTYMYNGAITSTMICAGYIWGGIDTCQGDSGGPLVTKTNSLWWLVGDTSWGEGCARVYRPGIYGNVTVFLEWIYLQMKTYS